MLVHDPVSYVHDNDLQQLERHFVVHATGGGASSHWLCLRETKVHEFVPRGSRQPIAGALGSAVAITASGLGKPAWGNSQARYRRSVPLAPGVPILSPCGRNAAARQGREGRTPIACSPMPNEGTPAHTFASHSDRTPRASLKHCSPFVTPHRVPCRWSTPQRQGEMMYDRPAVDDSVLAFALHRAFDRDRERR